MAPGAPDQPLLLMVLDVDGVLNASYRDGRFTCLVKSCNLQEAEEAISRAEPERECCPPGSLERLAANEFGFSELIVRRLADLIREAPSDVEVIISSTWRHPRHRQPLEALRCAIERQLGREFHWAGATQLVAEHGPRDRLRNIGAYLGKWSLKTDQDVRLIVLDDFGLTPFDGWACDGAKMYGPEDAEEYLLRYYQGLGQLEVKVIHTYALAQTALGLTERHAEDIATFLAHGGGTCVTPSPPSPKGLWTPTSTMSQWNTGVLSKAGKGALARSRAVVRVLSVPLCCAARA